MPRLWTTARRALLTGLLVLSLAHITFGAIQATFEVRKAANEFDTELNPGQELNLEVWTTLTSDSALPKVTGISTFLNLNDATDNGAITFNGDWALDPALLSPTPFLNSVVSGTANSPVTGEFATGAGWLSTSAVTVAKDAPVKVGTFSITALSPATPKTLHYEFLNVDGQRAWKVNFAGGSTATLSNGAPLLITVTPEPGSIMLMLLAGSAVAGRRRRR